MNELTRRRLLLAGGAVAASATAGCGGQPDVTVTDATVDAESYAGDPVAVEATVENAGDAPAETAVALSVDGREVAERAVELDADESTTVAFEHAFAEPGEYEVAVGDRVAGTVTVDPAITVASASVPDATVPLGSAARLELSVRNRAGSERTAAVTVRLDGTPVERRVTVDPTATTTVAVGAYPPAPGEYELAYEVADSAGTVGTVEAVDAWHQFGHGAGNAGAIRSSAGPDAAPEEAWAVDVGSVRTDLPIGGLSSSPVAVPGDPARVYVVAGNPYGADDHGALLALDAADGAVEWVGELPGPAFGTPAVVDGSVVAGIIDGAIRDADALTDLSGHLTAVGADDGSVAWSREVADPVFGSPAVADGVAYATTVGGDVVAGDAGGERRWTATPGGPLMSGPAVADGTVYVLDRTGLLHALSADGGETDWTYDAGGSWSAPAVAADGTVYVAADAARGGQLHAVAPDGSRLWRNRTDDRIVSSPAVGDSGLYASVGISTWAFEREDGSVRWRGPDATAGAAGGAPALAAGPDDGTVYAGVGRVNGGLLQAFDAGSGEVRWSVEEAFAGAAPAVLDGSVYATYGFGTLAAFR